MPLTGAKFYPNIFHANNRLAARDIVAFLIDDHATITGPGWSIVEAYDGTAGSRQTPSTTTGTGALASFTGTFSWKDDTVAVNDWIVLRTNIGGGGTEFQLYLEADTSTTWQYKLIPLDDFATDPTSLVSPPVLPVSSVGSGTSPVTHSLGNGWYSVVADEQMVTVFGHLGGGGAISWGYIGSLDQPHPSDIRPFVIYDNPGEVSVFNGSFGTYWNRLSPIDQSTILGTGYWSWLRRGNDVNIADDDLWLHNRVALPVGVLFENAGHVHFAGFTRHVYQAQELMGHRNVIGNLDFVTMSSVATRPGIAVKWDGTTEW